MKRRTFIQLATIGCAAVAAPIVVRSRRRAHVPSERIEHVRAEEPARRFSDRAGNLYGLHSNRGQLALLSADGEARATAEGLGFPISMIVDDARRVLVLELGAGRISLYDQQAQKTGVFGDDLKLRMPRDLARAQDTVAVADTLNHRVVLLDPNGRVTGQLGADAVGKLRLNGPSSVAFASDARMYVADAGNARVLVYDRAGKPTDVLGGYGRDPGKLLSASCVRLDAAGNVYVLDRVAGHVSRFDAKHEYRERLTPALAEGTQAVVRWMSNRADGSILYTLERDPRV